MKKGKGVGKKSIATKEGAKAGFPKAGAAKVAGKMKK